MRDKLRISAGLIMLLGILGICTPQGVAAPAADNPFVVTVPLNAVTNFNYTSVTIPAGKRLVVDYVSMSGAAAGVGGPIQPIVILAATLTGGLQNLYYFVPQQDSQGGALSSQFYGNQATEVFADDTLLVGPAFAGFSPQFDVFNVVITGHLVDIPKTAKPPAT